MKTLHLVLVEEVLVQVHLLGNLQELESAVNAAAIQIKVIYDPKTSHQHRLPQFLSSLE